MATLLTETPPLPTSQHCPWSHQIRIVLKPFSQADLGAAAHRQPAQIPASWTLPTESLSVQRQLTSTPMVRSSRPGHEQAATNRRAASSSSSVGRTKAIRNQPWPPGPKPEPGVSATPEHCNNRCAKVSSPSFWSSASAGNGNQRYMAISGVEQDQPPFRNTDRTRSRRSR